MRNSFVKALFVSAALYAMSLYIGIHVHLYDFHQGYSAPRSFIEQNPEIYSYTNLIISSYIAFVIITGIIALTLTKSLDKKFSNR